MPRPTKAGNTHAGSLLHVLTAVLLVLINASSASAIDLGYGGAGTPQPSAPSPDALLGGWVGTVNGEEVLLVFQNPSTLTYDGDPAQYQLGPGVIRVFGQEGPADFPYQLQGQVLWINLAQGPVAFRRASQGQVQQSQRIDDLIRRLLTFYRWESFSFRSSGSTYSTSSLSSTSSGKLMFFPDGTFGSRTRQESSFSSQDGLAGSLSADGTDGRWEVRGGRLYMSQGQGPLEEQTFWVKCNYESRHEGKDPFFLTDSGDLFVDGEGKIRCACFARYGSGGWPYLMINGKEFGANSK